MQETVCTVGRPAPGFGRGVTLEIKGIALILMFCHHFFTFPRWWGEGISYPVLEELAPVLQAPFRICVPVFCFLTGYLYAFRSDHSWRYSLRKMTDLLLSYWLSFAVVGIAAVVTVHWKYTPEDILLEMFGIERTTMMFAWYVLFYILAMLILPLVPRLTTGKAGIDLVVWVLLFPLLMEYVRHLPALSLIREGIYFLKDWFPCLVVGYLWGRGGWMDGLPRDRKKVGGFRGLVNAVLRIILILAAFWGRWFLPRVTLEVPAPPGTGEDPLSLVVSMDLIYAPMFVFSLAWLLPWLPGLFRRILDSIGEKSMVMWFISCIFFANTKSVYQPVLYAPGHLVLVLLWGLFLCWLLAAILGVVIRPIQGFKNWVIFRETTAAGGRPGGKGGGNRIARKDPPKKKAESLAPEGPG